MSDMHTKGEAISLEYFSNGCIFLSLLIWVCDAAELPDLRGKKSSTRDFREDMVDV